MQKQILLTGDGSHTVYIPDRNLSYHSRHGAIAESMHVFIEAGLLPLFKMTTQQPVRILEIGFGTGLNALLTMREAEQHRIPVRYATIECDPLTREEYTRLNYGTLLSMPDEFLQLHTSDWEQDVQLTPFFEFEKRKQRLEDLSGTQLADCIYFDAFAPLDQPELWQQPVFEKLFRVLSPGGMLLTYCSKSEIRRYMSAAGFTVEKIPGPHGKREMVRAWKDERPL